MQAPTAVQAITVKAMPHPTEKDAYLVVLSKNKKDESLSYLREIESHFSESRFEYSSGLDVFNNLLPKELKIEGNLGKTGSAIPFQAFPKA